MVSSNNQHLGHNQANTGPNCSIVYFDQQAIIYGIPCNCSQMLQAAQVIRITISFTLVPYPDMVASYIFSPTTHQSVLSYLIHLSPFDTLSMPFPEVFCHETS